MHKPVASPEAENCPTLTEKSLYDEEEKLESKF